MLYLRAILFFYMFAHMTSSQMLKPKESKVASKYQATTFDKNGKREPFALFDDGRKTRSDLSSKSWKKTCTIAGTKMLEMPKNEAILQKKTRRKLGNEGKKQLSI